MNISKSFKSIITCVKFTVRDEKPKKSLNYADLFEL